MKVQLTALIAALAITNPAYSQGTSHLGGKATLVRNPVVQAIFDSGFGVVMDDPTQCADTKLRGAFITYKSAHLKPDFLICMNNHSTHAELSNTIRHEAYHAIVHCKGGATTFIWADNLKYGSVTDIGTVVKLYDAHEHNEELEARNVARLLTDKDVAGHVRRFCM